MRITVTLLYRIVPRHLILQRIFLLIFPKSEPGQLQKLYATAWKINFMDAVEVDPTTTSAKCNRTLHQPDSSAVGLNLKDTDNLSPSTPKDSWISESDEFDMKKWSLLSQESPKMEEFFRDFDWELDRFVEYRLPIKKPLFSF